MNNKGSCKAVNAFLSTNMHDLINVGTPKANNRYWQVCIPGKNNPTFSDNLNMIAEKKDRVIIYLCLSIQFEYIQIYIPTENTGSLSFVHKRIPAGDNLS